MDSRDKELYEQAYKKQSRFAKKVILTVFGIIGAVFSILGVILLAAGVHDEDGTLVGAIFLPMGLVLIAIAVVIYFTMPDKGNYERYKKHIEKYGYGNSYETFAAIEMLVKKNEELEKRVKKLEEKLNDK